MEIHCRTCDYTNNDGVYFQWRYYLQDDKLFLRILTNIKLLVDSNDTEVQTYIEDNYGVLVYEDQSQSIKEEIASITTLAGLVISLLMVVNLVKDLFNTVKDLFIF